MSPRTPFYRFVLILNLPANQPVLRDTADIERVILEDIPLLDVRAPIEYERGCIGDAENIPLLDNKQREMVGTEYADKGHDAALELGLRQATDEVKASRVRQWSQFTERNPEGYLYCFRGGLRSAITQQWLQEAGIEYPRIIGGYKAMRSYLLQQFERLAAEGNILVLASPTGCGKTNLICRLSQSVDIEGLAKHRGSAFGSLFVPQPSQINWENQVASEWLKVSRKSAQPVMFESESHLIGRISLPEFLQNALRAAPVVELVASTQDRIKQIRVDYIGTAMNTYRQTMTEDECYQQLETYISHSLSRIQRRLGGERHKRLSALVPTAVAELKAGSSTVSLDLIVKTLLHDYYDPLYAHKMIGREDQVVFKGSADEIVSWLRECPA